MASGEVIIVHPLTFTYRDIYGTGSSISGPTVIDGEDVLVGDTLYNPYTQRFYDCVEPGKFSYTHTKISASVSRQSVKCNSPSTESDGTPSWVFKPELIADAVSKDSAARPEALVFTYFLELRNSSNKHLYCMPDQSNSSSFIRISYNTNQITLPASLKQVTIAFKEGSLTVTDANGARLFQYVPPKAYSSGIYNNVSNFGKYNGSGYVTPREFSKSADQPSSYGLSNLIGKYELVDLGLLFLDANRKNTYWHLATKVSIVGMSTPPSPSITSCTFDAATGVATTKVSFPAGKKNSHKSYGEYEVRRSSPSFHTITKEYGTSVTKTIEVENVQTMLEGEYKTLDFWARQVGIAGSTGWTYKGLAIARPKRPAISEVSYSDKNNGIAVFKINVYSAYPYYVDGVRLQALVSSAYETEESIPTNANWSNIGQPDNGNCTSIAAYVNDVKPLPGRYTWVRIKSWRFSESVLYSYSAPIRLKDIETPVLQPSEVSIYSVTVRERGMGLTVTLVWEDDDSTATEISWSKDREAWDSTNQPDTFDMEDATWDKGTLDTYDHHAIVHISDIDENTEYWIRAVRHKDVYGEEVYGEYCAPYSASSNGEITYVTLFGPTGVTNDEGMTFTWEHNGLDSYKWSLELGSSQNDLRSRATGTGSMGTTIQPETWMDIYTDGEGAFYGYGMVVYARLSIIHPNGVVYSNVTQTTIIAQPKCVATCVNELHSKPLVLIVQSSDNTATVNASLRSLGGVSGSLSAEPQVSGDVVWSTQRRPQWELSSEYSSDEAIEAAKLVLDTAQANLDAKLEQLSSAKAEVANLTTEVTRLTSQLQLSQSRIAELEVQTDVEDPDQTLVDELTAERANETAIQQSLQEAESDLEDAIETEESIDTSDEVEALQDAVEAYAAAEAVYLDEHDVTYPYVGYLEVNRDVELFDLASYEFTVTVTEPLAGLTSDASTCTTEVNWLHKAVVPSNVDVTAEIIIERDEDDNEVGRRMVGSVVIGRDQGTFSDDYYNVYRKTQDGLMPIASDVHYGYTILDEYPVFGIGPQYYVVEAMTKEGSSTWMSYEYGLLSGAVTDDRLLRIDWENKYIEFTHCVEASSSYEKDVEIRKHLDGSVSAYWNSGTMRSDSLSAAVIRGTEANELERLRELAQYEGTCMIRMSDGIAYEGTVTVNNVNATNRSAGIRVSLTTQQVDQTGTFMAAVTEEE